MTSSYACTTPGMHPLSHEINWTDPFPSSLTYHQYIYLCEIALDLWRWRKPRMWPLEFADNMLAIANAGRKEILSGRATLMMTSDESYPKQWSLYSSNPRCPLHYRTKAKNKVYLSPDFYRICKDRLDRSSDIPTEDELCDAFGYSFSELKELKESHRRAYMGITRSGKEKKKRVRKG